MLLLSGPRGSGIACLRRLDFTSNSPVFNSSHFILNFYIQQTLWATLHLWLHISECPGCACEPLTRIFLSMKRRYKCLSLGYVALWPLCGRNHSRQADPVLADIRDCMFRDRRCSHFWRLWTDVHKLVCQGMCKLQIVGPIPGVWNGVSYRQKQGAECVWLYSVMCALTQTHGCFRASWAVILLAGLIVSIWLIRFFASGVTVSHSGEGN